MTKKRTGEPWKTAADYGRMLTRLSINLLVRDVARSLPFYTDVLGFTVQYSDDHCYCGVREAHTPSSRPQDRRSEDYDGMPWAARLEEPGKRGLGAEIRIMGIDPDGAERRARERGDTVLVPTQDTAHGWRDCIVEDPDGYTFAVGVAR